MSSSQPSPHSSLEAHEKIMKLADLEMTVEGVIDEAPKQDTQWLENGRIPRAISTFRVNQSGGKCQTFEYKGAGFPPLSPGDHVSITYLPAIRIAPGVRNRLPVYTKRDTLSVEQANCIKVYSKKEHRGTYTLLTGNDERRVRVQ